jgi:hypothetical protein
MTTFGVTMVRDEEDVIEYVVRHTLEECDGVIVGDNDSADRTREILESIDDPRLTVVDLPGFAYHQRERMNALATKASVEYGAEWVVPFDADEWWYSPRGRIADVLAAVDPTIIVAVAAPYEWVPEPDDDHLDPNPFSRIRHRRTTQAQQKVAFRPGPGRELAMGNHHLEGAWPETRELLEIGHVPYRSVEQARRKVVHGKAALEAAGLATGFGFHWRELGDMSEEGFADWWRKWTDPSQLVRR